MLDNLLVHSLISNIFNCLMVLFLLFDNVDLDEISIMSWILQSIVHSWKPHRRSRCTAPADRSFIELH